MIFSMSDGFFLLTAGALLLLLLFELLLLLLLACATFLIFLCIGLGCVVVFGCLMVLVWLDGCGQTPHSPIRFAHLSVHVFEREHRSVGVYSVSGWPKVCPTRIK